MKNTANAIKIDAIEKLKKHHRLDVIDLIGTIDFYINYYMTTERQKIALAELHECYNDDKENDEQLKMLLIEVNQYSEKDWRDTSTFRLQMDSLSVLKHFIAELGVAFALENNKTLDAIYNK